jgi:FkbM family methyltransferase
MPGVKAVRTKLGHIGMLWAAADNPAPLVLDSLRLQPRPYTARLKNGLSFSLQPRCGDWFTLLECAVRMDYFRHGIAVHEGDTVVDVGANFGAFSITASRRVGESGRVFSYEPDPLVFERLQQNIRLNRCRNVTAFNEAVGADDGKVDLFIDRKSAFSTTYAEVDGRRYGGADRTAVAMRSIASVIGLAGPSVALLKIDCEGAEYDILERLTPEAAARVGQVAVELHHVPGRSVDSVPPRLAALGFDVRATEPLTAFRRLRADAAASEPRWQERVGGRGAR